MKYILYEDGHVRKETTDVHPVLDPIGDYEIGVRREATFNRPKFEPTGEFDKAILYALNVIPGMHVFPGVDPARVKRKRKTVAKQERRDKRVELRNARRAASAEADSQPAE